MFLANLPELLSGELMLDCLFDWFVLSACLFNKVGQKTGLSDEGG